MTALGMSHGRNQIFVLLRLASLTERNVFKVHPGGSMCHNVLPFPFNCIYWDDIVIKIT